MTKKQKKMRNRILIVLVLFVLLLVLDKSGILWGLGLSRVAISLIYLVPYLIIGYDIITKAFKNIRNGQVFDENFLMMVATFAAFGIGEYSEALAVMLFYQIGELFQSYAVGKSRQSITEMMEIAPEYANLEKEDGSIEEVDPDDVEIGSIIVVKSGEKVPLDGVVVEGDSFLNTAALTGESVPRHVKEGEEVISGCVNGDGTLKVRTTKVYEDSTVAKILELVENASSKKARLENFITRFAKYYTPVVTIGAALLAVIPPLFMGEPWSEWISRACIFLIVSCPCALVISVPLGFFGGIGAASKLGVLVKGSNYLEMVSEVSTIVFDKTGTLTKGEFKVSELHPAGGVSEQELLETAAYGEAYSTHPIALSIRSAYEETGHKVDMTRLSDNTEVAGHGINVKFDGKTLLVGNQKLLNTDENVSASMTETVNKKKTYTSAENSGENGRLAVGNENQVATGRIVNPKAGTIVYVALDGKFLGTILISDTIKEGAVEAIHAMKEVGIKKTVMLTGDRKETAEAVAAELGMDEVHAELLPADKVAKVEQILNSSTGKNDRVAFVGDGINDAPVLMRADVGIAMGSLGSDAAIEAADIVLMDDDLRKTASLVKIARKTLKIVKQNIIFALAVKALVLILGALGMATMWAAVFADVGVSVIAILNSMRALRTKGI